VPGLETVGVAAMMRPRSVTIGLTGLAWDHTAISYAIAATRAVDPGAVEAVLRAVRNWNAGIACSPVPSLHDFVLVAVPAGQRPDIEIFLSARATRLLGWTQLVTRTDGSIAQALVTLAGPACGRRLDADVVTTVAVQELGHALGLGHADDPADPMYTYFNGSKLRPSACDVHAFGVAVAWHRGATGRWFSPPTARRVRCTRTVESLGVSP
jgi:hypothetical protein